MSLPPTGSSKLLAVLSAHIPDDVVLASRPRHSGSGRRSDFSAAQLFRVTLLSLLTPVRSFNLLCQLLVEQRAWRRFALLPNRLRVPSPRQLHEFRGRLTPTVLRGFNAHLLQGLLARWPADEPGVALIDCKGAVHASSLLPRPPTRSCLVRCPTAPGWPTT